MLTLCLTYADVPLNCSESDSSGSGDQDEDEDADDADARRKKRDARGEEPEYKILDQYLDPSLKQKNDKQILRLKNEIKEDFRKADLTASFKKVFEVRNSV